MADYPYDAAQNIPGPLGEIGLAEPEVLAALRAACEHPVERVRREAREALITIRRGPRPTRD